MFQNRTTYLLCPWGRMDAEAERPKLLKPEHEILSFSPSLLLFCYMLIEDSSITEKTG